MKDGEEEEREGGEYGVEQRRGKGKREREERKME